MRSSALHSYRDRYSGFDALRFIAAIGVLWSHSYAVRGVMPEEPLLQITAGTLNGGILAVSIFFAISGYLVTRSFLVRADGPNGLRSFLLARALRIMPGLFVCLVVTTLACSMSSVLPQADYWASLETWRYLISNVFLIYYNQLPGVFLENPAGSGVNGSIWTLPLEVGMYAATFVFGVLGVWKSPRLTVLVLFGLTFWCVLFPSWFIFYPHTVPWVLYSVICYLFAIGSCVFQNTQRTVCALFLVLGIAAIGAGFLIEEVSVSRLLAVLSLTMGSIWIGRTDFTILRSVTKFGDLSYGVFLYSAPVQQLLVWARPDASATYLLVWSTLISLVLAFLSWRFVESPMLKLKWHTKSAGLTYPFRLKR